MMSLLLQAKRGLGFFEPLSLPAAGAPKEQGANKRKSMDLGARPSQGGELTRVRILSLCWTCSLMHMRQGAKRRRCINAIMESCFHALRRACCLCDRNPSSFMASCIDIKSQTDRPAALAQREAVMLSRHAVRS